MKLDRGQLDLIHAMNREAGQRSDRWLHLERMFGYVDAALVPPEPLEPPEPCDPPPHGAPFEERISAAWQNAAVFASQHGDIVEALRCVDQAELVAAVSA